MVDSPNTSPSLQGKIGGGERQGQLELPAKAVKKNRSGGAVLGGKDRWREFFAGSSVGGRVGEKRCWLEKLEQKLLRCPK